MPISQNRLAEIAAIADEDIDTSDIPEAGEAWFKGANLVIPQGPANPATTSKDEEMPGSAETALASTAQPRAMP